MARLVRFVPYVFALLIIVSLMAAAAWGGGGTVTPEQTLAAASGDDTVLPPGASQDWWSTVQEDIRQSEYHISWQEDTGLPDLSAAYQAPNRAQNLRTYFTETGIQVVPRADSAPTWDFGLTLTGYSYEGDTHPVAAAEMAVEENRADYDRGDVAEWYVNTEEGLEQGFTLNAPPAGQGSALVLRLSLTGDLTPALAEEGQAIDFTTATPGGVRVLRYADLKVNDAEGNLLDASLGVSGDGLSITIDAASAVFPITVDPVLYTPSWMAEGNLESAAFGRSVATAGDVNGDGYSDVIVGAPGYSNGQTDEGRAYVYLGSASGLSTSVHWYAESDYTLGNFGYSVGTAGDVNGDGYADVIIGAPYYASEGGGAFVYYGSASGLGASGSIDDYADWTVEGGGGALFGRSVGTAGDVNGDGYSDVIVGAPQYSSGQPNEGRAYVYFGSASGLSTSTPWTAESNETGALLGCSVGTAGDVNGDGYSDIIVGADEYGIGGGAFVWCGSSSGLGVSGTPDNADWIAESDQADSGWGCSVGTAGDVNGDGYADVIVGAQLYDSGQTDEGAAFVWYGSSDTNPLGAAGTPANADWRAESNQASAQLGCSAGTAGDVDGDGYADIIIGAHYYTNGQTREGAVALWNGSSAGPNGGVNGIPSNADWGDEGDQDSAYFGRSVSTAGDVNGDGYSDVIVGAPSYDDPDSNEGAAAVYCGYASGPMATPLWAAQSDQAGAHFGDSVGTAGDVNGDGYADVIVGAPYYDGNEGRAYVFHGSATGLNLTAARTLENNVAGSYFGTSVGTAGDIDGDGYDDVIIGAVGYSNGESHEGAAYVYYGSAGGVGTTPAWSKEGNAANASFGVSVSTAGDVNGDGYSDVIVGAHTYTGDYTSEGRACVFLGSASGLATTASWTVNGGQANADFGISVSTAGDVNRDGYSDVIVGAHQFTDGEDREGAAFVYHGSAGGLSTTPAWSKESDLATAYLGVSVSTAGDVNGDGYSDVIIGAYGFSDYEGAALVYHGSAAGLSTSAAWSAESYQAQSDFGQSVGAAGDVNGDGYADVIVGARRYDSGESDEGAACTYYGSATGLSSAPDWLADSDQANAYFGCSVATAGDVNGDGYADVIVGAYLYDYGQTDEGAAFLYYGGGHRGVSLRPRQGRSDDGTPIAHLGISDEPDTIRLTVNLDTPFGRGKAKAQFEVKPLGTPFNGSGLQESSAWNNTEGGGGYSVLVSGLSGNTVYHWRVRLHYNPATTPFQQYSRWFTMPWNGWQEADFRTANTPPVAVGDSSYSTNEDTALTVAAAGVLANDSDAEGDPLTAVKVTNPSHGTVTLNSNGSFTYTPTGNYNGSDSFTYKANDGRDDSNTATVTITINAVNDAPSFTNGSNQTVAEDAGAQTVSGWATDISAGPSDESGQTVDFIFTNDNNGLFSVQPAISPSGTLTYTPAADASGSATVTISLHDSGGTANGGIDTSAAQTFTITVTAVNDPPTATGDTYSAHRDTTLNVPAPGVLANDSDIDSTTLTAVLVSDVSHGTLVLGSNGSLAYTPAAGYSGEDSFTYHTYDGSDYSNTVTVNITVLAENHAPVSVGDSYTVDEDASLDVPADAGVLGNDTDADTDPLKATLVTNVSHGVLVLNDNGSFTYTPADDFNGTDSFTYKVNDGLADSTAATVTITVTPVDDPPVATGDAYEAFTGIALSVLAPGVLGNDGDADGDTLTVALVSNVSHGTLTLNPNGSFTYTAESGFAGTDSFNYKVNDGTSDSAAVTVTIGVTLPEPPTITSITKSSGRRGSTQTVTITGTNLDGVTELYFGEGIAVSNPVAGSPTEITAEITITSDAALGARDVRVTTPEGTFTLEDGFTVAKAGSGGIPPWVWILVVVAILAAGAGGIMLWRKRSKKPA